MKRIIELGILTATAMFFFMFGAVVSHEIHSVNVTRVIHTTNDCGKDVV